MTTKTTTTRKSTTKKTAQAVETPAFDLSSLTPEMIAQLQVLLAQQTPLTQAKEVEEQPVVFDKRWLKSKEVKDREVRITSCNKRVIFKNKKTGEVHKWLDTGDDLYLTVDEILTMDNQSHKFLRTPWLLIDDPEVVEAMGLKDMYDLIERVQDIDTFVTLPLDQIEADVNQLTKGFKGTLARLIDEKVENKELRDILVIRKFEELLSKDFDYQRGVAPRYRGVI